MRRRTVAAFALLAAFPLAACVDPKDRRPGLRLSGEVVEEGGGDWAFTDAHREIHIETSPPWLLPHSVTIVCAARDGRFFVGARNPDEKRWVANVDRDPDVRLKIGEKVYEQRLVSLDDEAGRAAAYAAYAAKYDLPATPDPDGPPMRYFEVVARR